MSSVCFTSSLKFGAINLFNFSCSSGCVKLSHSVLVCIFLITNDVGQFVMYLLVICVSSLGSICSVLLPILSFALFLLIVEL